MSIRRATGLVLVALVSAGAGLWLGERYGGPPLPPLPDGVIAAAPGDPVPDLRLAGLDGAVQPLRLHPGRPQLFNVWASWCPPCVSEMPVLDAFAQEQGDDGIEVVGIALDDPEAVRAFLARVPARYRHLLDSPGPADSSVWLGNRRGLLPYSVLVDADGRIVRQHMGELDARQLRRFARLDPRPGAAASEIQTSD